MKLSSVIVFSLCLLVSFVASARDILIKDAKIYALAKTDVIEQGDILIRDGRISAVGKDIVAGNDAQVIEAGGKVVTPGLFNAYTHLGLVEIQQVSQTVDLVTRDKMFSASYNITPALNPYSTLIPFNRMHGLTLALVAPEPGHNVFAGQAAIIQLDEDNNFILNDSAAVFASFGIASGQFAGGSRAAAYARLRQAFIDALEYDKHREQVMRANWRHFSLPLHDLDALLPVLKKQKPLVVSVDRASDIKTIIGLKKEFALNLVITGATEAWMVAEELAAANIPVIINPMNNLPGDFDSLAARLDNAAQLQQAGVLVSLSSAGMLMDHNAYLVRQGAGNAAAYGMSSVEAVKAMTLNPARIFGLDNRFGSIEPGKQADLVIWDGDPLELFTRAGQVMINGKLMPMVSRSTRLRDRYRDLSSDEPFIYRK